MTPKLEDLMPAPTAERRPIDWDRVAKAAIGSAVLAGLISGTAQIVGQWLADRARPQQKAHRPNPPTRDDDDQTDDDFLSIDDALSAAARGSAVPADVADAAAILSVDPLRVTQAEVRRAMRARLAKDGAHPDHGGDAQQTRTLIEARDRLLAFLAEHPR